MLAVAGSVLMVAALLKLAGSGVSAYAQFGWLLSANVQVAIIAWELLLGFALIVGWQRPIAWMLALVTFSGFAIVSGYLGIIGQASCDCFGSVQASPWAAFGLDVGMLVGLGIFRPRFGWSQLRTSIFESGKWAGSLTAVFAVLLGLSLILYGSPTATLAKLKGETLTLERTTIDFGHGKTGDVLNRQAIVTNHSDQKLRIVGGTADCSCITTTDLPVTIAPGESKSVSINYRIPHTDQTGITNRQAILMTDCPVRPMLTLTLSASVDRFPSLRSSTDPILINVASCGGDGMNGCTGGTKETCDSQGTDCRTRENGACTCKWTNGSTPQTDKCGCWANAPSEQ